MDYRQRASLFVLTGLAGCGGGGDGTNGVPVVSAPAPSASTSPAPATSPAPGPSPTTGATASPGAAYPTFAALAGNQQYAGACVGYTPRDQRAPVPAGYSSYSRSGAISYTASTRTYRVYTPNNVTQTFGPADAESGLPAGTIGFSKASPPAYPGQERFRLVQLTPNGIATDYARSAYINISGAAIANGAGTFARTTAYCTLGVPTLLTDVPNATSVSFTRFAVTGEALDNRSGTLISYTLAKSNVTLGVDLTTGTVTSVLTLIGTANGVDTSLGTYALSGYIDQATAGLVIGSAPGAGIPALFAFGGFYGPQGKEFGYAFSLSEAVGGDPRLTIVGIVTGAR